MPEGPEVKTVTDWLSLNFTGCQIIDNSKFPQINGTYIHQIHCKGKQIFFVLDLLSENRDYKINKINKLYLNSRLGMTGRWSSSNTGHIRFWMKVKYFYINNLLDVNTYEVTIYNTDTRNFGNIEVFTEYQYINKLNDIGPDLLSDIIDSKLWYQKIKNSRIKNKYISDYLLEQKYFSGIGNYLKSEILYRAKIRPNRSLVSLTDEEINTLLKISLETIRESYLCGGLTIKDFWSPDGKRGEFKCKIYNRDKDDFGYTIIKEYFDTDRATYWVSEIQK